MNTDNIKKVCIVGLGVSGIALCDLLFALGKIVVVSVAKDESSFPAGLIEQYRNKSVAFFFGESASWALAGVDLVVLSPGVDIKTCGITVSARIKGIPCVGEIEFASWFTQARIIAITGTNGKTTTTHLVYELLKKHMPRVFVGGNIGTPFSSFVLQTGKDDIIVLEVSSFQMETIIEFKPYVAALLNIEPDHMDRYGDFSAYLAAKANIFKNQKHDDWALLNKDSACVRSLEKKIGSSIVYFSRECGNENFSCVYRIAKIFGLSKADCLSFFSEFKGLPHRMELVEEINGISFINDSKATNPASTIWALRNIKRPVILLAGGKDKALDYLCLRPYLKRVKKINAFGQAGDKICRVLGSLVECQYFSALEEAARAAFHQAQRKDVVLLSPMCASFDAFRDYRHRGERFAEVVRELKSS